MPTTKKGVTTYLRPDVAKRVKAAAKAQDRSVANYIEHLLVCAVEKKAQ